MSASASYSTGPVLGPDFPLPLDRPFTGRQALDAGISAKVLRRLDREGYVRRLLRGVYVAAQAPDALLLRAEALALVVPEHAVVVDWTAVWLFTGLLPPGDHLRVPPVSLFRQAGHGRLRNELCRSGERTFVRGDVTDLHDLSVTTPLRTAWDIGRFAHRDLAIGALDGLLRTGAFTPAELLDGVERFRRQRGVVQLRALAPLADGRAESPGESLLRLRWHDLPGLPQPEPQVPIHDDRGFEVFRLDLGVRELRFAVEYDGADFHSLADDVEHDRARRAWISERRGWLIVPVTRASLSGPGRDIEERLVHGVAEARRNLARPLPPPRRGRDAPPRR